MCVKTVAKDDSKVFINICHSDLVWLPSDSLGTGGLIMYVI